MYVNYCKVGTSNSTPLQISLPEIALNIVTDWLPTVPHALAPGFADFLNEFLEVRPLKWSRQGWVISKDIAQLEKQWKQATSWILGVAFCRKVIELEGYPWWAPVSIFTQKPTVPSMLTKAWSPHLLAQNCRIQQSPRSQSRLMPDYVVARRRHGINEISFVESKGTARNLIGLDVAPEDWREQARNAEFSYKGKEWIPKQNLVVATRLNPNAKRDQTRHVFLRAWNTQHDTASLPFDALREIVVAHYFGVCRGLGLPATAELLAFSNIQIEGAQFNRQERHNLARRQEDLRREAEEEIGSDNQSLVPLAVSRRRSIRPIGNLDIEFGLTAPAHRLIIDLQDPQARQIPSILNAFLDEIGNLTGTSRQTDNMVVRSDGVAARVVP